MEPLENLKRGEKATIVSGSASALLAVLKLLAGILSGSVALLTSALDSFSDLIGMLTSWFGFRISQRKPDERFPYGYYKAESISTLLVSALILYAAYRLLMEGYSRLFIPPSIQLPFIAMSVAFLSILISGGISRYMLRVGEMTKSELLITNSKERMADVLATSAVFVAVAMSYMNVMYVEGIVTIIISLLILRVGIFSARDAVFALMDVSPSRSQEKKVLTIIRGCKEVEQLGSLRMRKSGPFVFGEAVIRVNKAANVDRAHQIADDIERKVKSELGDVVMFTVHVEPYKSSRQRIAIPAKDDAGLESAVSENFGRAERFLFVDIDRGKVISTVSKSNPVRKMAKKAGLAAVHFIIRQGADVLTTRYIGEIAFHTLRDHLVDIYGLAGRSANDVVELFIAGKLDRLNEHTHA